MRPGGGIQGFHLVLVGYTLRCRGGVSSMRVTPSLVLPLRLPGVTPWVACPPPAGSCWSWSCSLSCFGWSWAWSVSVALPRFRILGRDSGFSPDPGGLHLAVQRGSEQHEGHTLAGPPSETSRGHSPSCLPSPPPRRLHPHFHHYILSLLFPCEKLWLGVGDGCRFVGDRCSVVSLWIFLVCLKHESGLCCHL